MHDRIEAVHKKWLAAQEKVVNIMQTAAPADSPVDLAEGIRWAGRLTSIAQDWILEKNDPLHPVLFLQQGPYRKFIVDNPDVNYHFCVLDDQQIYRLSGSRGDAPYIGLTLGTDVYHWGSPGGGAMGTLEQSHIDAFTLDASGHFSITIGGPALAENWMPLPATTQHLAIRETFTSRDTQQPAELKIERLGEPLPAPRLELDAFLEKMETASNFMPFVADVCVGMYAGTAANLNQIGGGTGAEHVEEQDDEVESHCNTEMAYMGGRWKLNPGEALEVVIHPPRRPFVYWGLTLVNPWCESYDYRYARTCTNNGTATCEENGDWRLVIAAEDPGVPNWLDTGGRLEGKALLRWCLAPGAPQPTCTLTTLEAIRRGNNHA